MLYPPYIEGTIPSFYGDSLTVPFSMNKSVGSGEVQGFSLKIKTIQNTKYLFTTSKVLESDTNAEYYVKFDISDYVNKLKVGQHYKVQIAYIDTYGTIGYYSTVGIIKYTTKPIVSIDNLKSGRLNTSSYNYIGTYSQYNQDITEKEYKYRFIFSNDENKTLKDTGWQIHNNSNDDTNHTSHDEFLIPFELDKGYTYYLQYKIITNNNLEVASPIYRISQQQSIEPESQVALFAEVNKDNGYVVLTMEGEEDEATGEEKLMSGAFLISRACENSNFKEWEEILRFKSKGIQPSAWKHKDFTVEQGKEYIYSLQQYNDFDLYSNRIQSNKIFADFEDMFLYDGNKQLKISYNPQVSNFKIDVLESKTDTIGSKYAFFTRNGNVEYKEFNLNGLISYLSDEEHLFMTDTEIGLNSKVSRLTRLGTVIPDFEPDDAYFKNKKNGFQIKGNYITAAENQKLLETSRFRTTQLTGFNFSAERTFKLKVLEWLNNGEPKLFRSPGEGNYIVRLMNVSLSPEDTLGRMLHNFSCTAYEIDDYTYNNLNSYGITQTSSPELKILRFKSEMIKDFLDKDFITNDYAVTIKLEGFRPGDKLIIKAEGMSSASQTIIIGATGIYQIDTGSKIFSVKLDEETKERYKQQTLNSPMITYSYYEASTNTFNTITSVDFEDIPVRQYIGEAENIIPNLNDIKTTLTSFYYLHFLKRDIVEVEVEVEKIDDSFNYIFPPECDNIYPIYKAKVPNLLNDEQGLIDTIYYDLKQPEKFFLNEDDYNLLLQYSQDTALVERFGIYDTQVYIDKSPIDLRDIQEYSVAGPILFNSIELTVGTVLECGYSTRITNYSIENQSAELKRLKQQLDKMKKSLQEKNKITSLTEEEKQVYYDLYKDYIILLTNLKTEEDL